MKKYMILIAAAMMLLPHSAFGADEEIWKLTTTNGEYLTDICYEPSVDDEYISDANQHYRIIRIEGDTAVAELTGTVDLPSLDWMDADIALPVSAVTKRIALYCTHSDESYEPSDGFYTTTGRGTIYEIASTLAEALENKGIEASAADTLHHPHDAGAYRRSRQTAVELLKTAMPDCLIDIHRDGIPDPASYAVTIGGEDVSKIRLLVGRGNQNAEINKEFALMIKAVADRVYPGLIKDIYMGKGTFNQDLLPKSILFECGTYTLEKERVLASMPLMADVLNRALYGGVVGSAGKITSDVGSSSSQNGGIVMGEKDAAPQNAEKGTGSGFAFIVILLLVGVVGFALLSTGSLKGGMCKAGRTVSEMTGGLMGKKPRPDEDHEHS